LIRGSLVPAFLVGLALLAAPSRPLAGEVVPWQGLFLSVAGPRWIDRAAQVQAESGFNPHAVSYCGAQGPAQFMPGTWLYAIRQGWVPAGSSPFDPAAAIPAQNFYMNQCEAICGGFEPGLGGFNAGPSNIRKAQRLAQSLGMTDSAAWLRTLPRVTGEAHAGETRGYLLHNATFRAQIRARLSSKG
jgi:soluble lytic murein transglycosylase-like protein